MAWLPDCVDLILQGQDGATGQGIHCIDRGREGVMYRDRNGIARSICRWVRADNDARGGGIRARRASTPRQKQDQPYETDEVSQHIVLLARCVPVVVKLLS